MFRLSSTLTLPANAAAAKLAWIGMNGSGKSYGAGVFVEELLKAKIQVVVVDPVGIWWGLRVAADGDGRGFDLPVFGGHRGDVPLESTGGELVADLVAERAMSMVIDVSDFTGNQMHRFVGDFARRLFWMKKKHRSLLHIVWDEGHEFFPQVVDPGAAPMAGETKRLWKVGRNYGIAGSIITPRVPEASKSALNLCDILVTGRTKAPNDIKVIDAWVSSKSDGDQKAIEQLRVQPKGMLTVWTDDGAVTSRFRKKITLDTSSTPEAGAAQEKISYLPPITMDAIRAAMAATIAEAKANDPKALREEIAALKRRIADGPPSAPSPDLGRLTAQVERLNGELVALQGITPIEVRRLRDMETRFEQAQIIFAGGSVSSASARIDHSRPVALQPIPRATVQPTPTASTATTSRKGWTPMEEEMYQKFKERLLAEAPGLLKVLATSPEIEVVIERQIVEIDGKTLRGRIARLIAEGFLDSGHSTGEVTKEIDRTGPTAHPSNVHKEIKNLIEMGFIHKTDGGRFVVAPGAKVNIKRAA